MSYQHVEFQALPDYFFPLYHNHVLKTLLAVFYNEHLYCLVMVSMSLMSMRLTHQFPAQFFA